MLSSRMRTEKWENDARGAGHESVCVPPCTALVSTAHPTRTLVLRGAVLDEKAGWMGARVSCVEGAGGCPRRLGVVSWEVRLYSHSLFGEIILNCIQGQSGPG